MTLKLNRTGRAACAAGLLALGMYAGAARGALMFALTDENDLIIADTAASADIISGGPITGLGGQDLIGIDVRPANGQLYGVGNLGGVFNINTTTRAATLVSTLSVPLSGTRYGLDFNPVADLLRIVSDTQQNLRVTVDTGATIVDSPIQYGPAQPGATGDDPNVVGAAYTNSFPGADVTTLYVIDVRANEDRLSIQAPPNNGTLTVVGPLGVNASAVQGFEIAGEGQAFAALQEVNGGISRLYSINLGTGTATLLGDIGGGDLIDGLALAIIPEPASLALLAFGGLGALSRRRRVR